jgi:hypothetical protein
MKHFIQYVDLAEKMEDRKVIRLLEFEDLINLQAMPQERTIRMMAPEEVCKVAVIELSRLHPQRTFAWGHEEADGRTWLHGFATDGVYKKDGKVVPKRKMRVAYVDGRDETIRPENDDAFEIDLTSEAWANAKTMSFYVGGVEAVSLYLKKEGDEE